jgi:hypothetical protein
LSLARGAIHANKTPKGRAAQLVVLSEDDWNRVIPDVVAVPVFKYPDQEPSLMLVALGDERFADCTKVQTVEESFWGTEEDACDATQLAEIEGGVRAFLSLTQMQDKRPAAPAKAPPSKDNWWPAQGLVRYAQTAINDQCKMHAVISEDYWNEIGPSWSTVRLTRWTKAWRSRWEVPVTGGYVVSGDLFATPRGDLDPRPPRSPRPNRLTADELADTAAAIRTVLQL